MSFVIASGCFFASYALPVAKLKEQPANTVDAFFEFSANMDGVPPLQSILGLAALHDLPQQLGLVFEHVANLSFASHKGAQFLLERVRGLIHTATSAPMEARYMFAATRAPLGATDVAPGAGVDLLYLYFVLKILKKYFFLYAIRCIVRRFFWFIIGAKFINFFIHYVLFCFILILFQFTNILFVS